MHDYIKGDGDICVMNGSKHGRKRNFYRSMKPDYLQFEDSKERNYLFLDIC
jgi:hypothetical protein